MQNQPILPDSAANPSRSAEAISPRFDLADSTKPSTKAKPDFWSAAGAIFAQQNRVPRLTRSTQHGPAPLSLAQERLWTLEQSEQGAPYYHVPLAWQISGLLDIPALEKALA